MAPTDAELVPLAVSLVLRRTVESSAVVALDVFFGQPWEAYVTVLCQMVCWTILRSDQEFMVLLAFIQ